MKLKKTTVGSIAMGIVLATLLISPAGTPAAGKTQSPQPDALQQSVLDLVHDARFDEADDLLAQAVEKDRGNVSRSFLISLVTYWRLLFDPDNSDNLERFEQDLDRTIDLASRALAREETWDAALWNGSAYLMKAQLHVNQKKPFKAGFDAKKANRYLRRAVVLGSDHAESDFGLGTYQYYAAQVPTIIKALRALLAIPGGDRDEGLRRLRRAGRESRFFALEARIVLATIYSDGDERLYDQALKEMRDAGRQFPGTLAVLYVTADLHLNLHRPEQALQQLQQALSRSQGQAGTAASVISTLRYQTAVAQDLRFRPELALDCLRPLLSNPDGVPPDLLESARKLGRRAAGLLVETPGWLAALGETALPPATSDPHDRLRLKRAARALATAAPALALDEVGQRREAARKLSALLSENPDSPVLNLLAGRTLLFSGSAEDAIGPLQASAGGDELPAIWKGPARLLTGMALDLVGQRDEALNWYRQAEQTGSFRGRDAARLYQSRPALGGDLGWEGNAPGRPNTR